MSYDLVIWRIKPGTTVSQMNEWIDAQGDGDAELENFDIEAVDLEADSDDDEPDMPPFVEAAEDGTKFVAQLAKPFLGAVIPEDERSPRLHAWLSSKKAEPVPDDLGDEELELLDELAENAGPGHIFFPMSYGDDLLDRLEQLWPFMQEIWKLGYAVFDPQVGRVIDPDKGIEDLREAGRAGMEFYKNVLAETGGGGPDVSAEMAPQDFAHMVECLREADGKARAEDFETALGLYSEAWNLIPAPRERFEGSRAVAASIGQLHAVLGDLDTSLEWLGIAQQCPGSADDGVLQLLHGQVLFFMGREDEARERLELARELEGEEVFDDAPELLEFLRKG